jgi:hypothetical protein
VVAATRERKRNLKCISRIGDVARCWRTDIVYICKVRIATGKKILGRFAASRTYHHIYVVIRRVTSGSMCSSGC